MKNDLNNLDEFTIAYLECALWAESWSDGEQDPRPFDENYSISDFTPEAIQKAIADCKKFQEENAEDISDANYNHTRDTDAAMAGHDFWLTRNGHGAGFWVGDLPVEVAERLSKVSDCEFVKVVKIIFHGLPHNANVLKFESRRMSRRTVQM